jgi:hypothetical protein
VGRTDGGALSVSDVFNRWSALGVHHVFDLALRPDHLMDEPIILCPTKAELQHRV